MPSSRLPTRNLPNPSLFIAIGSMAPEFPLDLSPGAPAGLSSGVGRPREAPDPLVTNLKDRTFPLRHDEALLGKPAVAPKLSFRQQRHPPALENNLTNCSRHTPCAVRALRHTACAGYIGIDQPTPNRTIIPRLWPIARRSSPFGRGRRSARPWSCGPRGKRTSRWRAECAVTLPGDRVARTLVG